MFRYPSASTCVLIALIVAGASAQVPLGHAALMTSDAGTAGLLSLDLTFGTTTPIAPVSSTLAAAASTLEIDPLTGDFLVGSRSTSGDTEAEIHRLVLSGLTVISETRVLTLPGTDGVVLGMEREQNGCIILLCSDPAGSPVFFRLVVTPAGETVTQIPVVAPPGTFWSLAVDANGDIYTCDFSAGSGFGSTVYRVGPSGGTLVPTGATTPFAAADLEIDFAGSGLHAGGLPTSVLGPNYQCGGAPFRYGPTTSPYSDVVQEIAKEGTNGDLLVVSAAANVGATVWRLNGCAPPGVALTFLPLLSVSKIVPAQRSRNYGCACPTSQGVVPLITQTGFPQPGGTWTLNLTNALPNRPATLVFGLQPAFPTEIPGTVGCFSLNSGNQTYATTTNRAGAATITVSLPAPLSGVWVHAQWYYNDPFLNVAGIGATAGLAVVF